MFTVTMRTELYVVHTRAGHCRFFNHVISKKRLKNFLNHRRVHTRITARTLYCLLLNSARTAKPYIYIGSHDDVVPHSISCVVTNLRDIVWFLQIFQKIFYKFATSKMIYITILITPNSYDTPTVTSSPLNYLTYRN